MACISVCPKSCIMVEQNNEGFLYPVIKNDTCIKCNACRRICPIIDKPDSNKLSLAYAAYNKNDQSRYMCSSGGIFALLAMSILEKNGVVYGAAFNEILSVKHISAKTEEELNKLFGSKYVQSNTLGIYSDVKKELDLGKNVLFSGTPCQISGLKNYLQKDYENLYLTDIICHGVPSPKLWVEYIKHMEKKLNTHIVSANFRNKKKGWKDYSVELKCINKKTYIKNVNEDLYMRIYLNNFSLRTSCYNCEFKAPEKYSDITLGDFWGIEKIYPELCDNKGISAVLINSERGMKLFDEIKNMTKYKKVEASCIAEYNPSLTSYVKMPDNREAFFRDIYENGFDYIRKIYFKKNFILRIKTKVKAIFKNISTNG